jgi:hypothetical protein
VSGTNLGIGLLHPLQWRGTWQLIFSELRLSQINLGIWVLHSLQWWRIEQLIFPSELWLNLVAEGCDLIVLCVSFLNMTLGH